MNPFLQASIQTGRHRCCCVIVASLVILLSPVPGLCDGFESLEAAIREAKPLLDARLRFESVDQDPMAHDADAATLRMRLGFETGKAWNSALLVEGELLWPLSCEAPITAKGIARTALALAGSHR